MMTLLLLMTICSDLNRARNSACYVGVGKNMETRLYEDGTI
jgi:hypothetical protein